MASHEAVAALARKVARGRPALVALARLSRSSEPDAELRQAAYAEVRKAYLGTLKAAELHRRQLQEAQQELGRATEARDQARRMEAAAKRIDQFLTSGPVEGRIRELRQSLWRDNLDRALAEATRTEVRPVQGGLELSVEGERLARVRAVLEQAARRWIEGAAREVQRDLRLLLQREWAPLEGDLPVRPPALPVIPLPWDTGGDRRWWDSKEPPALSRRAEVAGFWGQVGRQVRGLAFTGTMFGAMFFGALGLSDDPGLILLGILPAVAILAYLLVQREQARRRERAIRDSDKAIRDEMSRWVEGRLDRVGVHLRDYLRGQLAFVLRAPWRAFYAEEVGPRGVRAEARLREAQRAVQALQRAQGARDQEELEQLEELLRPGA